MIDIRHDNVPPDFKDDGRIQTMGILGRPRMKLTPKQKVELDIKLAGLQKSVDKFLELENKQK